MWSSGNGFRDWAAVIDDTKFRAAYKRKIEEEKLQTDIWWTGFEKKRDLVEAGEIAQWINNLCWK